MAQQREIKGKMGTVKNVKKITKTMEAVSASKMKKAMNAALRTREYATLGLELLKNLSQETYMTHPLLQEGAGDKTLVVMYASNKGLCGSFNIIMARSVWKYLETTGDDSKPHFIAVGKYAEKFARKTQMPLIASFTDLDGSPDIEQVLPLARLVVDEFNTGAYNKVVVVYTNFISALRNAPVARDVLPVQEKIVQNMLENTAEGFEAEDVSTKRAQYIFEPDEEEVLQFTLEKLVEVMLYQALLESAASEHASRRNAMKNATDNAGEVYKKLELQYNRARQASITQEIAEISAGAEAIK